MSCDESEVILNKTLPLSPIRLRVYRKLYISLATIPTLCKTYLHFEHDARLCEIAVRKLPHLASLKLYFGALRDDDDAEASEFEDAEPETVPEGKQLVQFRDKEHFEAITDMLQAIVRSKLSRFVRDLSIFPSW